MIMMFNKKLDLFSEVIDPSDSKIGVKNINGCVSVYNKCKVKAISPYKINNLFTGKTPNTNKMTLSNRMCYIKCLLVIVASFVMIYILNSP